MKRLEDKVALVSGAGRGAGAALALKLAAEGAAVVVNDLDAGPAAETVAAVTAAGGRALACAGDVTAPGFAGDFIATAIHGFGGADIVVNNAGYIWNAGIGATTDEQWDAMQDVHLKAAFRIARAWNPWLVERAREERDAAQGGVRRQARKMVNVSSVSGTHGAWKQIGYSSAKAGLIGLTKSLAREWGPLGVTVNAVAFGLIETRLTQVIAGETSIEVAGRRHRVGLTQEIRDNLYAQTPLRRGGAPEDAAGAVLLFCLPESDFITGQIIEADGGVGM
ncbi:beta-ketoacyl-ACP reductase [Camelimonas fluminis]|uniref:SDR family NAD(P)-dependent oxidoreductase n=1 Tax=Camelimonas fluminis TaxID=1576911 RepID=A0ABV7UHZ3_9HYPH|nr:SDR family oxidoreductase [Camelimonas fluminis]GHE62753.1 beta-ketoacyl-ACP reductase [Camelimonas fluminis]